MVFSVEELITICKNQENIYIYGAGKNANRLYLFLMAKGIRIKGFIVSDVIGNPEVLFGHPVVAVGKFRHKNNYIVIVSVSRSNKAYREIYDCLMENRKHNAYFLPADVLESIKDEVLFYNNKSIFNNGMYHIRKGFPVEDNHYILVMEDAEGTEYHWRFRREMAGEQAIDTFADMFPEASVLEEFEKQYGKYHVFRTMEQRRTNQEKTCTVYMACSHVDKMPPQREGLPDWIVPVQAGAVLTDREICGIKDNMGENISEKNSNYSEGTVIYWMWKNAPKTDYIGLCHYRRRLDMGFGGTDLQAVSAVDVLVTSPTFVNETVGAFFSRFIPKSDIKAMLEAIGKHYPDYRAPAEEFLKSRFYPPCNLFIMKYDVFREYSQFTFSVTFEIERFYDALGFFRRDRYMGFIMECLLGIFLMKNKERLNIGYTDMVFYP